MAAITLKGVGRAYAMAGSLVRGALLAVAAVADVAYGSLCLGGIQGSPENNGAWMSLGHGVVGMALSLAGVACVALYWARSGHREREGDAAKGWALFSAAVGVAAYAVGRLGVY